MVAKVGVRVAIVAFVVVLAGVAAALIALSGHLTPAPPAGAPAITCASSAAGAGAPGAPDSTALGNWTTYHGSNARTGDVATAGSIGAVHAAWSRPIALDGQVYAEPLVCGATVFVATENNTVYAINDTNGTILWKTHVGTPVEASTLPCGDIGPVSGITGTPVIDVATRTLYAVAFLPPAVHELFGLDTATGAVTSQVNVTPPGSTANVEQQRGALLLLGDEVYVPYGGLYGDCGPYHGWVVGASTDGSSALLSYQVPTGRAGGIWAPGGIALGPNGNLYVTTGNSDATATFDYGDAVIELSPGLTEVSYFAPTNWAQLNANDIDLGSLAPTVLANGDIFQVGKAGVGYLLSGTDLGGIGGSVTNQSVCSGAYGGTARVGSLVLVPCTNGLVAVSVNAESFSTDWTTAPFSTGSPIVTGSVAWTIDVNTAHLLGFNLTTGSQLFSLPLGAANHFCTPAATPGELFVTGGDQLFAFDLS